MSDATVELARRSFRAWQQRDVEWFIENTTPEFEFVAAVMTTVEGEGGTVRGGEQGIRQYFAILDEPCLWFDGDKLARAQSFLDVDEAMAAAKEALPETVE
jgi:hypothetical protein